MSKGDYVKQDKRGGTTCKTTSPGLQERGQPRVRLEVKKGKDLGGGP